MLSLLIPALFTVAGAAAAEDLRFEDYFLDKSLRVDILQFGHHDQETICIDALIEEPHYAGPLNRLIDERPLGGHRFDVYDAETGIRIFSRGFCTLFGEWRTTAEAHEGKHRVFEHVLIMPYPKKDVVLAISRRSGRKEPEEIFRRRLDLDRRFVRTDNPFPDCKAVKLQYKGDPHEKVDVVILGDGYTATEMRKYLRDAKRIGEELLSEDPMAAHRNRFNLWAVECPSAESGVDEPRRGSYRSTVMGSSFNAFDLTHYCLSMEIQAVYDVAAAVPHDAVILIFNSPRYGGGGIYNLYAMVSGRIPGVIAHEFGHHFAGLADEYYNSPVTYIDFYPEGVEPWEPNITALLDPAAPKWAEYIKGDTPIPTPNDPKYQDRVGCFEGAGYRPKGMYRPCHNCIMLSCRGGFCPVCKAALEAAIRFHAK